MTNLYGRQLSLPVAVGSFGQKTCSYLGKMAHYLEKEGVSQPVISAEEMNVRYCDQLNLPTDFHCVWDNRSVTALLNPVEIVSSFQKLFVDHDGVFLDNHCVTDILPGDCVTIRTNKGDFSARKVIITAGGWAPKLLKKLGVDLPLKVQRAEVLYWKVDCPERFTTDVFPLLVYEDVETMDKFYVFPIHEYPGLIKVYYRTTRHIDPDHRDIDQPGPESVEKVARFIKKYLKGVSTTPAIFEHCIYTLTPDYLPVIDRVPMNPNIMFAAGLSGIGFKLAPAFGQLLTDLALDRPLLFDISSLRSDSGIRKLYLRLEKFLLK